MPTKHYTFEALDLVNNGYDHLLSNITYIATKLLNCPVAIISVAQPFRESHYISASYGLPYEGQDGRRVDFEQSVCKIVCDENRPLVIQDLLEDPRTMSMQEGHHFGYRSYIGVPIHSISGKSIGSLCCLKAESTDWGPDDIDLLQRLTLEINDIIKSRTDALELEAANTKLRKMLATRSSFSTHLTHEVRTPLTGMLGSIKLLARMDLDGQASELVKILDRSSSGLLKIVNDTLDFAKLDAGKFILNEEPCNIGELARDIVAGYRDLAEEKNITVDVEDQISNQVFMADRRAIISVLQNLFSNAVKFTQKGYALIRLTNDQYGLIKLEIIDTGIGIEAESQSTIFDEFQQANPRIARKYGGTGLGMTIVKRLVEEMRGDIRLDSELGKGTTVTVWLSLPLQKTES